MSSAKEVLKVWRAEIGYTEKETNDPQYLDDKTANAGNKNFTKYARDIDSIPNFYNGPKQGYPWCTTGEAWAFVKAFGVTEAKRLLLLPKDSLGAGVYYLKRYFQAAGQLGKTPKVGALVFFGDTHTGIVSEVTATGFKSIEGNTSPASGVVDNGGMVCEKVYNYIGSSWTFGYPDYTEDDTSTDDENTGSTKPKLYLSPAYHMSNECCYKRPDGKQCYETLENNEFMDLLEPMVIRCGFDVKRGPRRTPMSNENGTDYMYQAIKESNAWGAKIHYISHTNGSTTGPTGNGKKQGFLSMYHSDSANGKKLAQLMAKYRKEIYPYGCNTLGRTDLHELEDTNAYAVYQEHAYHDNPIDAAWFHEHMKECAIADCKALCEFCGIEYVPEPEPEPTPDPVVPSGDVTIVLHGLGGESGTWEKVK